MKIKTAIKNHLPIFRKTNIESNITTSPFVPFEGNFSSWEEALAHSDGYDKDEILEKTLAATLQVKNGKAVFERDSVILDIPQYPFFLISSLLYIAALNNNELRILDFGGALGSSYFQCRNFLGLIKTRWNVVEQKKHVDVGRKYIEDEILHFYYTIDECILNEKPNVVLLSGVLHVIDQPYLVIKNIIDCNVDYVVICRQPLTYKLDERLCIMNVPPNIYNASLPYWFLSETRFRSAWADAYDLYAEAEEPFFLTVENERIPLRQFLYRTKYSKKSRSQA
jgi:putative methyltransferase (TIGR04325 family)